MHTLQGPHEPLLMMRWPYPTAGPDAAGAQLCAVLDHPAQCTHACLRCVVLCRLGLRCMGAAWALTCCTATNALLLTSYQLYRDKVMLVGKMESTWRGYSLAAFRGWVQYLRLGVPAAAMICLVGLKWDDSIYALVSCHVCTAEH